MKLRGWWVLMAAIAVASCTPYTPPVGSYSANASPGETGLIIQQSPQPGCGVMRFMLSTANFYFYLNDRLVGKSNYCQSSRQFVPLEAGDHRLRIDITEISPATLWTETLNGHEAATFNLDPGQQGYLHISDTTSSEWVGNKEIYSTKAVFTLSDVNNDQWE